MGTWSLQGLNWTPYFSHDVPNFGWTGNVVTKYMLYKKNERRKLPYS